QRGAGDRRALSPPPPGAGEGVARDKRNSGAIGVLPLDRLGSATLVSRTKGAAVMAGFGRRLSFRVAQLDAPSGGASHIGWPSGELRSTAQRRPSSSRRREDRAGCRSPPP